MIFPQNAELAEVSAPLLTHMYLYHFIIVPRVRNKHIIIIIYRHQA